MSYPGSPMLWQSYYTQQETGRKPKCACVQGGDNLFYSLQSTATKGKMSFK